MKAIEINSKTDKKGQLKINFNLNKFYQVDFLERKVKATFCKVQ